ncbi:hypothetical protein Pcinc_011544 [Petrolisthes cinctipes]|uniref:Uncharacterized protein n=1 Tax=Petrolisthes cinctipes TaxID=88211 RepID=A0AAE1G0S5_PETCI|nr:hypothetical protein Pcinc_011544 [Petrolisthes cinctipes]
MQHSPPTTATATPTQPMQLIQPPLQQPQPHSHQSSFSLLYPLFLFHRLLYPFFPRFHLLLPISSIPFENSNEKQRESFPFTHYGRIPPYPELFTGGHITWPPTSNILWLKIPLSPVVSCL